MLETFRKPPIGDLPTICIAHRNEAARELLRSALASFTTVIESRDGLDVLTILETRAVDLLIVSADLACVSGMSILEDIRSGALEIDPLMRVIILSNFSDKNTDHRAKELGANQIIQFPCNITTVVDRTKYVLNNPTQVVRTFNYLGPDRRTRN